mgnify:FL=1
MYEYFAKVVKVYDGDTITVDIDLGFGVWMRKQKIRLVGINTPEVRGEEREEGLKSRDWLREKILDKQITLRTAKDRKGKYGRWLGAVILHSTNINQEMISLGLAEKYVLKT